MSKAKKKRLDPAIQKILKKPTKKVVKNKVVKIKKKVVKKKPKVPLNTKCKKCRKTKKYCKCGRPLFDGKKESAVVAKLEEVFSLGGTDEEACFYADISRRALQRYEEKHPEFRYRKQMLKEEPILRARQTVVKALDNPKDAQWYLERKKKIEFAPHSTAIVDDGKGTLTEERKAEIAGALANWNKKLKESQ